MNITKYQHYEKIEFTGIQNFAFLRWNSGMWERTISHTICNLEISTLLEIMYQKEVGKKMSCEKVSKEYCKAQWNCCECPYNIEWNNPKDHITKNFTVHEALYLNSWNVYHKPSLKEQENIIKTALVMEKIRKLFKTSINVHCWVRPDRVNCPGSPKHGKDYNAYVGGAKASMHIEGLACDFHVKGIECIKVFPVIVPYLREFYIRIEKIKGSWVHIDLKDLNRIF